MLARQAKVMATRGGVRMMASLREQSLKGHDQCPVSRACGRSLAARTNASDPFRSLPRATAPYPAEEIAAGPSSRASAAAHDFSKLSILDPSAGGSGRDQRPAVAPIDALSAQGEVAQEPYLDQASPPAPAAPAPAPAAAPAAPAAAGPARPTNLLQLLTDWTPGANRYGFQLRFRCRSTSGEVRDLQNQAPNLIWREHVTYPRNDFSHRITPNDPTILPPGGVSFAAANTRRVAANLLEFNAARDTHWMPTTAVRAGDFAPAGPRPLPAVMESRQVYQYSPDGGTSWRYFAGAFTIRRTLFRTGAGLQFRTQKTGVHTVTEPYKP